MPVLDGELAGDDGRSGAEAADGTGDLIVPLSAELPEQLGWQIVDELSILNGVNQAPCVCGGSSP